MRKRRVALWVLLILLLPTIYRVGFIYVWRPGDCATGPQPRQTSPVYPKRLLVMTYNIEGHAALLKGEDHIEEIARVINEVKPDIVGLNEVHRRTWQARFDDQVGMLQRLTGMSGAFGKSYYELGGAFGNAVLTRGTILSADVHNLPSSGEPRSLLAVTIRIDQAVVNAFVSHLAAWGGINTGIRTRQLECLGSHARVSKNPYVVMGDLNAGPDSIEMQSFRRLNTTLLLCGETLGATQKIMNTRLDYIFAGEGWQVRNARVLDGGPSDHRAVIAELIHD